MDVVKRSLPWLNQPVQLHSFIGGFPCDMSPEQCAYKSYFWRNWAKADEAYGLSTIYFWIAIIGVFAVVHCILQRAPPKLKTSAIWRKSEAALRYLAYRGFHVPRLSCWTPSLGVMLLIFIGAVFFLAMTLVPQPYYMPKVYGGSPVIATRAGWMALGLLPVVLALSAKANLISVLTGVSHEKLNIFHSWAGYAMFVLALVHTFPYIVLHREKGDMAQQWDHSLYYWSGVAALVPQAYLTIMSFPLIRNRYYEFFKATHFLIALLFILFFFFHCDFILTSWDYFVAAGAVYMACLLAAQGIIYLRNGLHTATVDLLPCGLIRVKIPTAITWTPGQHVFARFIPLGLHSLTAHPFTISSAARDPDNKTRMGNEIAFYIKPKRGITARLAREAAESPGCSKGVFLEGPYGGLGADLARFDAVVVIAGGSGGGFSLGVIEEALRVARRTVEIVYATRDAVTANWYEGEIDALVAKYDPVRATDVSKSIHITSHGVQPSDDTPVPDLEKVALPDASSVHGAQRQPRPSVPETIASAADGDKGQRIGIVACGPSSMLNDARNAAAQAQRGVLGNAIQEVYLHAEPFG